MCKYLLDHHRVFDTGNHFDSATEFFTDQHIDIKYSFQALCPTHDGILLYRRSLVTGYLASDALASFQGRHQRPVLIVWREHAMEVCQIGSWSGYQGCQACDSESTSVAYGTAAIPCSGTLYPFLSESSLPAPALQQRIDTFPFMVLGFHSDNGSEYLNKQVAKLLGKLLIEFTKSRSRHSNEREAYPWGIARWQKANNGAVVRKLLGYTHIPQRWAPLINEFNQQLLNPYINVHRPCFFPEISTDDKGK